MKKFKFNKKFNLFLSTLVFGIATTTVLAACKPKTQLEDPGNGSGGGHKEKEKEKIIVKQSAKENVKNLLADKDFQTLLTISNNETKRTISDELEKAVGVKEVNTTLLNGLKTELGNSSNSGTKENTGSVYANLNFLKAEFDKQKADKNASQKTKPEEFDTIYNNLVGVITKVLENIDTLIKTDNNVLPTLKTSFSTKLNGYLDLNKPNIVVKDSMKRAFDLFVQKLQEKGVNLKNLIESAVDLQKVTAAFENYIKNSTNLVKDEKSVSKAALNNLVTKVKSVLGTEGDKNNQANNEKAQSTKIYKAIDLLEQSTKAQSELNKQLKKIIFVKDVSLSVEEATDLLSSVIDNALGVDSARLNSYLLSSDSNIVEVLKLQVQSDVGTINLIEKSQEIINKTAIYSNFVGKENSEFAKVLNAAAASMSLGTPITNLKRAKIEAVRNAFLMPQGVAEKFDIFYNEFKKSDKNAPIKNHLLDLLTQLNEEPKILNEYIKEASDLKGIFKFAAKANYIKDKVLMPLMNSVVNQTDQDKVNGKNILTLIKDLTEKMGENDGGSLNQKIKTMVEEDFPNNPGVKTLLAPFATKSGEQYTGYYYDIVKGLFQETFDSSKYPPNRNNLSLLNLYDTLNNNFKAQKNNQKLPLSKAYDLLVRLLKPFAGNQIETTLDDLYKKYNEEGFVIITK